MAVSEATFQRVTLEDDSVSWEVVCGRLRPKPPMTAYHGHIARKLVLQLARQLSEEDSLVGQESPNLRVPGGNYRRPDVCVVPLDAVQRRQRDFPISLEIYEEPMPLVVEVWSPSTGDFDIDQKLRVYQERGDREIWRIHPLEHTVIAWVRQADGSYVETLYTSGQVRPTFLPGVVIDLARLFD